MSSEADKRKEEAKKKREKAQAELDELLSQTRPKNLRQGVKSGVGNVLQGAVGAAGVAVLAPTAGLTMGMRSGGILGGIVGVAGGAVVGVVGGAALLIGGAVSGVTQVVRGVAAIPEQMTAPRKGKWWNEVENRWVYTDLPKDAAQVPKDDDDLLGELQSEMDEAAAPTDAAAGQVKDMEYYNALEVDPTADASAIKRRYYILARKYHPDKVGADDKEAAEKFKAIAEAYQVLSDPELRAKYDKEGKEGLSPDKTGVNTPAGVKPEVLFAFLFGSDKFRDYVGRLATATSASIGDSPKLSLADARKLQNRRCTRLAVILAAKLQPHIDGVEGVEEGWKAEAIELSTASYGIEMVHTIGKAYSLTAVQFLGSTESGVGLPSVSKWAAAHHASIKKKQDSNKNKMDSVMAGFDMMKLQAEYQQKMEAATTDEEKEKLAKELEEAASDTMLKVLWTTTVVDITSTLYEAAQMIFYDQSVDKELRKKRAESLKVLGETFVACPVPEGQGGKDAKTLYEEAAFAAMVETIKKKDDSFYQAHS